VGNFRDLQVWQKSKDMAVKIYNITNKNEFKKDYSLKDQIRRAAISIASNIAEGDERFSNKESIRFLYIANGSAAEVITQLTIAHEIGYINNDIFNNLIEELEQISKMIKNLIKYRIGNDKNK
jgi:four helix bundle protein